MEKIPNPSLDFKSPEAVKARLNLDRAETNLKNELKAADMHLVGFSEEDGEEDQAKAA